MNEAAEAAKGESIRGFPGGSLALPARQRKPAYVGA
jgi:hypothetical protein